MVGKISISNRSCSSAAMRNFLPVLVAGLLIVLGQSAIAQQNDGGSPVSPHAYLCIKASDECILGTSPGGVPLQLLLKAFENDLPDDVRSGRLVDLEKELAAKPGNPALLFEQHMLRRWEDEEERASGVKALVSLAEKEKDPLMMAVALTARVYLHFRNEEDRRLVVEDVKKALSSVETGLGALPNDDARNRYIGAAYFWAFRQVAFDDDEDYDPQTDPFAKERTDWLKRSREAFAARWKSVPDDLNRLRNFIDILEIDLNRQDMADVDAYVEANEHLLRLKPKNIGVLSRMIAAYNHRGEIFLQRSEPERVLAEAERMRQLLAPIWAEKKLTGIAYGYFYPAILEAKVQARSDRVKAMQILCGSLENVPETVRIHGLPWGIVTASKHIIVDDFKSSENGQWRSLKGRALSCFDEWDRSNRLVDERSARFQLLNGLVDLFKAMDRKAEIAEIRSDEIDWLQARPIGDNLAEFFMTIRSARREAEGDAVRRTLLTQAALDYVLGSRISSVDVSPVEGETDTDRKRRQTEAVISQLHGLADSLEDSSEYRDALIVAQRAIVLSKSYLDDNAPTGFLNIAASLNQIAARTSNALDRQQRALDYIRERVRLRGILLARRPFGDNELLNYGWALRQMFDQLDTLGQNVDKTEKELGRVVDLLLEKHSGQARTFWLALTYYNDIGNNRNGANNRLPFYKKSFDMAQTIRKRFGDDMMDFDDLAVAAMNIATQLGDMGQSDEAVEFFRIAHEASDKDFAKYPANRGVINRRIKILLQEAELLAKTGDLKQAVAMLQLRLKALDAKEETGQNVDADRRRTEEEIARYEAQLKPMDKGRGTRRQ